MDNKKSQDTNETLEPPAFQPTDIQPPEFDPSADSITPDHSQFSPESGTDYGMRWTPKSEEKTGPNWTRRILMILTVLAFACSVFLCILVIQQHQTNAEVELNSSTLKAATLVHLLETDFLTPAESLVQEMQKVIQHDERDPERLMKIARSHNFQLELLSFGIAYKPYGYNENNRLKAPFYQRNPNGNYKLLEVSDVYDYTQEPKAGDDFDSRWFRNGIQGDGGWQEPYYGRIVKDWMAEYSLPIFRTNEKTGKKEKVGIVFADFALQEVREMVRKITLNNLAYGYLVSPQGVIVSHPAEYLLGKPLIAAYSSHLPGPQGIEAASEVTRQGQLIASRVAAGESFIEDVKDEVTGQTSLVVHQKVPKSNWSFGIVTPKESVYRLAPDLKYSILYAAIAVALTILLGLAVTQYADFQGEKLPWLLSILTSVFATGIVILILSLFWDESAEKQHAKLFSVAETISARGSPNSGTSLIPTGVLVNNIEFPQPGTAAVTGVIWQKFALNKKTTIAHKSTPPGIIWPDAKLGSEKIIPLREYESDGFFVRSWRFNVEVSLERNIRKFPFDMSEIQLRMRSLPESKALLVPDFEAYDILIPEVRPGVDEAIDLTYWNIRSSFFSVESNTLKKYSGTQIEDANKESEVTFHIQMARLSHVTLISYFLPIFIGSIMMFVVLMIPSDRSPGAVFSTLSYGGTIFFIISIFHVNLRNSEGIDTFTFLESYYIMQHILVMLISLNGFFLMRGSTHRWLHYRNNLIPKTFYWPSLCLFLACSTAAYFL